jgi:hypothetical protein
MNTKLSIMSCGIAAIACAFAASTASIGASEGAGAVRSLEGVWLVKTTPRDCTTGTPFPAAAFEGLFTFHKGGTMSAWLQNNVITLTRSPSHGLWQAEHGWDEYSFRFVHLRYDIGSSMYVGRQEAEGWLVMGASGREFSTDSSLTVFDANGNQLLRGCGSAVGTRYE